MSTFSTLPTCGQDASSLMPPPPPRPKKSELDAATDEAFAASARYVNNSQRRHAREQPHPSEEFEFYGTEVNGTASMVDEEDDYEDGNEMARRREAVPLPEQELQRLEDTVKKLKEKQAEIVRKAAEEAHERAARRKSNKKSRESVKISTQEKQQIEGFGAEAVKICYDKPNRENRREELRQLIATDRQPLDEKRSDPETSKVAAAVSASNQEQIQMAYNAVLDASKKNPGLLELESFDLLQKAAFEKPKSREEQKPAPKKRKRAAQDEMAQKQLEELGLRSRDYYANVTQVQGVLRTRLKKIHDIIMQRCESEHSTAMIPVNLVDDRVRAALKVQRLTVSDAPISVNGGDDDDDDDDGDILPKCYSVSWSV